MALTNHISFTMSWHMPDQIIMENARFCEVSPDVHGFFPKFKLLQNFGDCLMNLWVLFRWYDTGIFSFSFLFSSLPPFFSAWNGSHESDISYLIIYDNMLNLQDSLKFPGNDRIL